VPSYNLPNCDRQLYPAIVYHNGQTSGARA
jgi:hypothetical protein